MTINFVMYAREATHHLCDLLDALAEAGSGGSVTLVTDGGVAPERLALGWASQLDGAFRHIIAPAPGEVGALVEQSPLDTLHIFVGMRHLACVREGIAACIALERRMAIMHETRVREGVGGVLRYIQSWVTEGRLRRHAIVLAIGAHGPDWFLHTGYRPDKVYPFAYFLKDRGGDLPAVDTMRDDAGRPIRIGYAGRLEQVKGIEDVMAAFPLIKGRCELVIAGSGKLADGCRSMAESDPRVTFLGALPYDEVQRHMRSLDIVIQPSRSSDDGWGAVVSEGLLNGAAIISSDVVGASMCLKEEWRGQVVSIAQPAQIAAAVDRLRDGGMLTQAMRLRRRAWALDHLSVGRGARYLAEIVANAFCKGLRPNNFLD